MTQHWRANSNGRKTKDQILGLAGRTATRSRFIARNTVEHWQPDGTRFIRYHSTDVLAFGTNPETITMDSGNWKTQTTRQRINDNLPDGWRVETESGLWYVRTPAGRFDFVDRAAFFAKSGKPCKPSLHGKAGKSNAADKKLIADYLRALDAATADEISGRGDPWIPVDADTMRHPQAAVREWLRERYVFAGIVRAAFAFAGDTGNGWQYAISDYLHSGQWASHFRNRVRRYLRACLGYAV